MSHRRKVVICAVANMTQGRPRGKLNPALWRLWPRQKEFAEVPCRRAHPGPCYCSYPIARFHRGARSSPGSAPYDPDINPIEEVFANLKHIMRKAAERTVQATWQRIGTHLQSFQSAECAKSRQCWICFNPTEACSRRRKAEARLPATCAPARFPTSVAAQQAAHFPYR